MDPSSSGSDCLRGFSVTAGKFSAISFLALAFLVEKVQILLIFLLFFLLILT